MFQLKFDTSKSGNNIYKVVKIYKSTVYTEKLENLLFDLFLSLGFVIKLSYQKYI